MTIQLTEDEQVEALKKWWRENGTAVIIGVVVGLGAVIGVRYWFSYQEDRSVEASQLYTNYTTASEGKRNEEAEKNLQQLKDDYKGTSYAALAAMQHAAQSVESGNHAQAEQDLRWALENPGHDSLALLARERLALVLVANEKPQEALQLLDNIDNPVFAPRYAEIRGDIYRAQGQAEKARAAYQSALADTNLSGKSREYIEMKLQSLGPADKVEEKN